MLTAGAVFLLPVVCWPNLDRPFSVPKLWLLICIDVVMAAAWSLRKRARAGLITGDWLALGWVAAASISGLAGASVSLEALLLSIAPVPLFWAAARVSETRLARALWLGALAESAVVLLQYSGLDPLSWFGWHPEAFSSPRMRVYGTMGNPDFVAAWCCATLPFCWSEVARAGRNRTARVTRWAALGLQVAAILATGSRVFALVLPLQAVLEATSKKRRRRAWMLALPLAAAPLLLAPTRPISDTLRGRLYLAQVSVSHWRQTPVTGYGPGLFETKFAQWQPEWLQGHRQDSDAARFAGAVDHAHNDYIELLAEYGPLGLGVFLGLAGWMAARAWRGFAQSDGTLRAAAVGAASLLVIAVVDFPFHRPAEWSLFWLFAGILTARQHTNAQGE